METIRNYIDGLFMSLPKTTEVMKAKTELLMMMEDKYNELKGEGKSENESIGIVISEFGNIDELVQELGIDNDRNGEKKAEANSGVLVSMQTAQEFISVKLKSSLYIATGVLLCIISPATLIYLSSLAEAGEFKSHIADAIGLSVLFVLVAIAVGIFIINGSRLEKFEYIQKEVLNLEAGVGSYVSGLKEDFRVKHSLCITAGVSLCIISAIPLILVGVLDEDNEVLTSMTVCVLLFLVAIAVFIFIVAGSIMESYNQLLQQNEFSKENKEEKEEENELTGKIAAIYWPLATVIYLLWSFITADWGITWMVWPVAGVLFGAIASICSMVSKN